MHGRSPRTTALLALLAAGVALAALYAVPAVREAVQAAVRGDLDGLRVGLEGNKATAALVLVGLAMVHVVIPFPAEFPTTAAGFALGFAVGFPLMLCAWVASGFAAYALARVAGRPGLVRILGEARMARAEAAVTRVGPLGLLGIRLVPFIPFSLVSFACGVTRVPLGRYAWTTALGTAPLTAFTVLLGTRLQTPSLEDPVIWAVLAGMLLLVAVARPVGRRLMAPS
jgi:uncharacterized membrane protein YdjX (TVP38/TMEM64 family)